MVGKNHILSNSSHHHYFQDVYKRQGLWGGQLQRYRDNKALECAALPEGNEQALPARVAKLSKDMLEFAEHRH